MGESSQIKGKDNEQDKDHTLKSSPKIHIDHPHSPLPTPHSLLPTPSLGGNGNVK
jgi:hypothetical protein